MAQGWPSPAAGGHLEGLNRLRHNGVHGAAQPQLPVLVPPEGQQLPGAGHRQRVRVAARHLHHVPPRQRADGLGDEHVVAVAMAQPPKVAPGQAARPLSQHACEGKVRDSQLCWHATQEKVVMSVCGCLAACKRGELGWVHLMFDDYRLIPRARLSLERVPG